MSALRAWTVSVGLLLAATAANAQGAPPQDAGRAGVQPTSDFTGPYADAPPAPPRVIYGSPGYGSGSPGYGSGYGYEYGADLLPPREVYAVLRENGFLPLGIPRLRGMVYLIAALDRRGEDGRLVIDARTGRILRFVPASGFDGNFEGRAIPPGYGPPPPMNRIDGRLDGPALPPPSRLDSQASPPAPSSKLANRMPPSIPTPKAAPPRATVDQPVAAKPAPAQQSAAMQVKPAEPPPAAPAAPVESKPAAPTIQPTQPMPKVQDLE